METGLTEREEQLMLGVFQRDVLDWDWASWTAQVAEHGEAPMNLTEKILPHEWEPTMPALWRHFNELYIQALEGHAAAYGLSIRFDEETRILFVYDTAINH